ncbi:MAG: N-acetylmuramic acid 6-phosphate etherase [Firmicutes bacterium]|nr:N-acetylmuramic acid 6-phosphate etherase [Bacillota bacterium]
MKNHKLEQETAQLMTEKENPRTAGLDEMTTTELLRVMNEEDRLVAQAVESQIPAIEAVVDAAVRAFRQGGRLVYLGAGTSGRLGVLDAAECPPTFGVEPGMVIGLIAGGSHALVEAVEGAEDNAALAEKDLKIIHFSDRDVLVGIAASGRTPYVLGGLRYAARIGAATVAISCSPGSAVSEVAQVAITLAVGPEVVTGSTRLKAGTATKMVLNMITTASMVRLGKVYGNLMVDVKASNQKLVARALRIVERAAGVSSQEAEQALTQADFHAKTAIVMLKRGCSVKEARQLLAETDGLISRALKPSKKEDIEG